MTRMVRLYAPHRMWDGEELSISSDSDELSKTVHTGRLPTDDGDEPVRVLYKPSGFAVAGVQIWCEEGGPQIEQSWRSIP